MARPPILVGPPISMIPSLCMSSTAPDGSTLGVSIPAAGLTLGAPVDRNSTAFYTGGGGTANLAIAAQRRAAGLQWEPKPFDPAARNRPSIFVPDASITSGALAYQHLVLKPSKIAVLPYGLIYARAVSARTGRIVSVGMTLGSKPTARPRMVIETAHAGTARCPDFLPIQVYAPSMSVAQIKRLFTMPGCNWNSVATCNDADRPRGRALFVQQQRSGVGYEHRWVDYDLLFKG